MTIKETIIALKVKNIKDRLNKLEEMNAPTIMVENTRKMLADLEAGNDKVNGMSRKYKVANVQVTELYEVDGFSYTFNRGKQKTVILKMVTDQGTYFYDYYGNKLGASMIELEAVAAGDFVQVEM